MIELLVMRHAKSDWSTGHGDFDRPLNDRGIRAADQMAQWLDDEGLCPDRVLSSAAARTRATAMAVVYACEVDPAHVAFQDDLYLADDFTWRQAIARQSATRLLICGHNPGLDDLVDSLCADPPPLSSSGKLMTTAAIAHFSFLGPWYKISASTGKLIQLVRP